MCVSVHVHLFCFSLSEFAFTISFSFIFLFLGEGFLVFSWFGGVLFGVLAFWVFFFLSSQGFFVCLF